MMLVLPYASVFMLAVGLTDWEIGVLATALMVGRTIYGACAGVFTDKLGRRLGTALFDVIAWVIPSIIWAVSDNFWFFLAAVVFNAAGPATHSSWDGLLIEDANRRDIPRIYALVGIAADFSAFFAPVAMVLVHWLGLETAVRVLYVNAAVLMAIKIAILYKYSTETQVGRRRRAETRGVTFLTLMGEYRGLLGPLIIKRRGMLLSLALMSIWAAVLVVNTNFWGVLVTGHLGVPDYLLPIFPMARSGLAIALTLTVFPRLTRAANLRRPLVLGFVATLVAQLAMALAPVPDGVAGWQVYATLSFALVLEAFGWGMVFILTEAVVSLHVDQQERSRTMSVMRTVTTLIAAPAGLFAGALSGVDRHWPFVLNAALLALGLVLIAWKWVGTDRGSDGVSATSSEGAVLYEEGRVA
jgi:MFS family permease